MDLKEKTLTELNEELSQVDFQWIKGDKMGNLEKFDSVIQDEGTGMTFVQFIGGGRINLELLEEYLETFPASKVDYNKTAENQILKTSDNKSQFQVKAAIDNKPSRNAVSSIELEESPIYKLLKQQNENWINVSITLKLNLPSKNLYNVLISSFNGANEEIINYVTEGVDIDDIREALAESIKIYYDSTQKVTSQSVKNKKEIKSSKDEG